MPLLILTLMLMAVSMISKFVTGSALHLSLVVSAGVLFAGIRFLGPAVARIAGFALAIAVGLGGWLMFEKGIVPISLSELPWLYHVAIGILFLVWSRAAGGRKKSGRRDRPGAIDVIGAVISGLVVTWTAGAVEIYGTSEWLTRSLGFGVLAAAVILGAGFFAVNPEAEGAIVARVQQEKNPGGGRWKTSGGFLIVAVLVVAVLAALVWPSQRLAGKLYTWFGIDDDSTRLEDFGADQPAMRSGSSGTDGAGRDLPKRADIKLDNSTARFFVKATDPESFERLAGRPVYLRTSTLSVFENDGRLAPLRSGEWRYDSDDGTEDGQVRLTGSLPDVEGAVHYSVLFEQYDSRAIPLVARTQSVALTSVFSFADDWYQLALEEHQQRVQFQAMAAPRTVTGLMESGAALKIGAAPKNYTALPATPLTGRISQIAASFRAKEGGESDLNLVLPEIRAWLKETCAYSLRYENPDDRQPLDNFLFGERKGHCELFAAGTVMMLRSLGIPSRVAYGYCGGAADRRQQLLAFRESDFHAWPEVYLDDHGWVIYETTPPGEGAVQQPQSQPGAPAFAALDLAAFEDLSIDVAIEIAAPSRLELIVRRVMEFVSDWFLAICAGLILIVAGVARWNRRSGNSTSRSADDGFWSDGPGKMQRQPPDFLADYLRICAELGFAKRPAQTLRELLHTLKSAGICNGEFDDLTRYLYGIRYAGAERDPEREKNYGAVVRDFREAGSSH